MTICETRAQGVNLCNEMIPSDHLHARYNTATKDWMIRFFVRVMVLVERYLWCVWKGSPNLRLRSRPLLAIYWSTCTGSQNSSLLPRSSKRIGTLMLSLFLLVERPHELSTISKKRIPRIDRGAEAEGAYFFWSKLVPSNYRKLSFTGKLLCKIGYSAHQHADTS